MKLIMRYLKPFAGIVVLCIVLLFGQAMSDLSLPTLMSEIVTNGIQNGGVEEPAPKAISENGMTFITTFMTEDNKQQFLNAYQLIDKDSEDASKYRKDYELLNQESIYVRKSLSKEELEPIETSYGKAALAFVTMIQKQMEQQDGQTNEATTSDNAKENFAGMTTDKLYELLPMIQAMPKEAVGTFIQTASDSDSFLHAQMGVLFTKMFYEELGMNLNHIQRTYIIVTGLKMLAITFAGVVAAIAVGFLASRMSARVAQRMRRDVFSKVESFSSAEYDKFSTASLITRTTNDIQQVQMLIGMGVRMMCYAPIMGIGGIIFAVNKSVSLSWIIAVAVIILLGLIAIIFSIALPKFKSLQKLIDRLNLVSRENLGGMMVIRAFGNEGYEENRFEKANSELSKTNRFVQRTMAFMMPAMMLIMNCVTLVIVWSGSHAIADSTLQIGDMLAFMQYAMQIIMAFLMIAMMFIMVPRASVSAVRIREVLDTKLEINDKKNTVSLVEDAKKNGTNVKGRVVFRDVSFRYNNAESDVLENINFTAKPGETTAFIGSTGSGKSTLINLVPRFYDVTKGSIEIDGVDIRDLKQEELRDLIGYVPQKGVLFTGDIESNIRYGKDHAEISEIEKAIEVAQAKDFVDSTEEGLKTSIAQGGTNVSGGQKQRLSIARALVKKPPIYIFDDSFSALDFKTDSALRAALKKFTSDATVLIVAQRVSTIMTAEQIIVLDEGKVVGIGTHKELLANCKEYQEIAESQLSKEELA
ncbi:ABC transporter ATP-binding protein [Lachnoclostridium phytofermentans]|uniref:ABC transporter related n=1 Tax=Lachnoclostridium phytofermentans (strain ATCC 700394 / DSM 18823 / ISDg) TaxID=357809 RepID=A9KLB2_LACP7|nr:ABC transporter ATP-binding protein [Lachnoclostridium phytofermentans]ABX41241.1 ABC transporter related [Lachnoclostridium phytofermentans ISDg]